MVITPFKHMCRGHRYVVKCPACRYNNLIMIGNFRQGKSIKWIEEYSMK